MKALTHKCRSWSSFCLLKHHGSSKTKVLVGDHESATGDLWLEAMHLLAGSLRLGTAAGEASGQRSGVQSSRCK